MTDVCDVFVIIGSCRKRWESFFIATLRRIIYLKDSENEGIAEMEYLQLDLTEEQRKVCNRLLECRDKEDCEYATHSYIAGLYDALRWWELFYSCKEASPCLHSLCSFW